MELDELLFEWLHFTFLVYPGPPIQPRKAAKVEAAEAAAKEKARLAAEAEAEAPLVIP